MAKLFAKFDLDFIDNPKIVGLSDAAFRAYVEGIVYSRTHLTDGFIDARIAGHRRWDGAAPELISNDRNPSWVEVPGGWQIHDFAEHQTTNADIEVIRERKKSAANKRWDAVRNAESMQGALQTHIRRNAKGMPETETETETETELKSVLSKVAIAPLRPDVESLLDLLDTEIQANGGKKPSRTKKNTDAMRLMLDRDGHTLTQVTKAIQWCQRDEFWRGNILSASKLRDKYEQLRLAAQRTSATEKPRVTAAQRNLTTVEHFQQLEARKEIAS